MKNLFFGILTLFSAAALVSCETQEEPINSVNKLDSYKIARDENGLFTLEHTTIDGFTTEQVSDFGSNMEKFYFDESSVNSTKYENALKISNNAIKVGFIELEGLTSEFITVEDDDLQSLELKDRNPLLVKYYVHRTISGKVIVFFKVKNGVDVSYGYNEELGENEIRLKEDADSRRIFKNIHYKTFDRADDGSLIITFVSSMGDKQSKSSLSLAAELIRKPRIIITETDGGGIEE